MLKVFLITYPGALITLAVNVCLHLNEAICRGVRLSSERLVCLTTHRVTHNCNSCRDYLDRD